MSKKTLKIGKNRGFASSKDLEVLKKIKELIENSYNLSLNEIDSLLEYEFSFPEIIFNEELTVLESVVKYLKENKNFNFKKISELIKRDQRNIWHIYDQAKKKYSKKFIIKNVKYWIPVSIFSEKFSAYESVVGYLKDDLELKYSDIARVLRRDQRTIWTIYNRARNKNGN